MDKGLQFLSELVLNRTYAAPKADGTKESWEEVVERVITHHADQFPQFATRLHYEIKPHLLARRIVPAMRWLQFAGEGIARENLRGFNCFGRETTFVTSEGVKSFADFKDGDVVTVRTHKGNWKEATVRCYGQQQLNRIEYKRGNKGVPHVVRATKDHRWILADGSETTDLAVGDNLYMVTGGSASSKVLSITPDTTETVWCLEVEDDHSFVFPTGVATGNCSFTTVESFRDFAEVFYVLMCGTGVGYSVQSRHIQYLPSVSKGFNQKFVVPDSKEGWSDSVLHLLNNPEITFDYSKIRAAGVPLSTGGTASGPEALQLLHRRMRKTLKAAQGRKLKPIEVHDMLCQIADGVVVGGVRRAALICLFDWWDDGMRNCKQGAWWEHAPWRGRANNSAVVHRTEWTVGKAFDEILDSCFASGSGEPGIYLTNDNDWGTNPCCEIALKSKQLCNLTEVNLAACQNDLQLVAEAVKAATFLGTLQATYTDFNYVSGNWSYNCQDEALLGVSLTGQAQAWPLISNPGTLRHLATTARHLNEGLARQLDLNPASRVTCVKPSGTASAFLGTTSGIHAAHGEHYIRRVRVDKSSPLFGYLADNLDGKFWEVDAFNPDNYVVSIPVSMEGAILREKESAVELLERMKHVKKGWIDPGHVKGANTHNVSLTVNYKEDEKKAVKEWMWENRDVYNGISLLPYDDSSYVQMPFEEISKERYQELSKQFPVLSLGSVDYSSTVDERQGELACAGGSCELK